MLSNDTFKGRVVACLFTFAAGIRDPTSLLVISAGYTARQANSICLLDSRPSEL